MAQKPQPQPQPEKLTQRAGSWRLPKGSVETDAELSCLPGHRPGRAQGAWSRCIVLQVNSRVDEGPEEICRMLERATDVAQAPSHARGPRDNTPIWKEFKKSMTRCSSQSRTGTPRRQRSPGTGTVLPPGSLSLGLKLLSNEKVKNHLRGKCSE